MNRNSSRNPLLKQRKDKKKNNKKGKNETKTDKSYRDVVRKTMRYTNHIRNGENEYAKLGASLTDIDISHLRRRHTAQDNVKDEQALFEFDNYLMVQSSMKNSMKEQKEEKDDSEQETEEDDDDSFLSFEEEEFEDIFKEEERCIGPVDIVNENEYTRSKRKTKDADFLDRILNAELCSDDDDFSFSPNNALIKKQSSDQNTVTNYTGKKRKTSRYDVELMPVVRCDYDNRTSLEKRNDYLKYVLHLIQDPQDEENDIEKLEMSQRHDVNFLHTKKRIKRLCDKFRGIHRVFKSKTTFDDSVIEDVLSVMQMHLPDIYTQHSGLVKNNSTFPLKLQIMSDLNDMYSMRCDLERVNSCLGYKNPVTVMIAEDKLLSKSLFGQNLKVNFAGEEHDNANEIFELGGDFKNDKNKFDCETENLKSINNRISFREKLALLYWFESPVNYVSYGDKKYVIRAIMDIIDGDEDEKSGDAKLPVNFSSNLTMYKKIGCPTNMGELKEFDKIYGEDAKRRAIEERNNQIKSLIQQEEEQQKLFKSESSPKQEEEEQKLSKESDEQKEETLLNNNDTNLRKRTRTGLLEDRKKRTMDMLNNTEQEFTREESESDEEEQEELTKEEQERRDRKERDKREEIRRVLLESNLREGFEDMIEQDSFWETVTAHGTVDDFSMADPYMLMPDNIEPFLFAPYGSRRPCLAGKSCRGMVDFESGKGVILMEFFEPRIETEYQRSGILPHKRNLCVLCTRYTIQRLINKIRKEDHRYTRCISPNAYHIDKPGSYSNEAMIANLPECTDGSCWPQRRYDPSEYEPCIKEVVYEDHSEDSTNPAGYNNGTEHRIRIRGFLERGEGIFFQ